MKKFAALVLSLLLGLGVLADSAFAAGTSYIDASVQPAIAQLGTDTQTIASYVWPVVMLVVGIGVAMALVKKFARKAG